MSQAAQGAPDASGSILAGTSPALAAGVAVGPIPSARVGSWREAGPRSRGRLVCPEAPRPSTTEGYGRPPVRQTLSRPRHHRPGFWSNGGQVCRRGAANCSLAVHGPVSRHQQGDPVDAHRVADVGGHVLLADATAVVIARMNL